MWVWERVSWGWMFFPSLSDSKSGTISTLSSGSTGDPRKDTHSSATVHSVSMWLWSSWCQDTISHLSLWKTPKYLKTPCWQSFGKSYSHMAEGGQSGINLWKKMRQNLPKLHNAYMLCPNNSTFRNSSKVHLIHIWKNGYQRGSLQPTLWE